MPQWTTVAATPTALNGASCCTVGLFENLSYAHGAAMPSATDMWTFAHRWLKGFLRLCYLK
jgi:hypothetical protein